MNKSVIDCIDLNKKYKDNVVLENLNLTIEEGKIYGLIGRNGVGKTTLLSVIAAHSPATSGKVTLDGVQIWENEDCLKDICFSRDADSLTQVVMNMKVKNYLKIAASMFPHYDKETEERLINDFGLDVNKRFVELSEGMKSMVTIIIAMASKAKFTFFDEPVAGLDVVARNDFYKMVIEEHEETGRTFVLSTHIIDEATDVFDEVVILNNKNVFIKENTQKLLDSTVHVSGTQQDIDEFIKDSGNKLRVLKETVIAGRKAVTVSVNDSNLNIPDSLAVQKMTLQSLFADVCEESK